MAGSGSLISVRGGLYGPMSGSDPSETEGLGIEQGADGIVAKGALLLAANADVG